MVYNNFSISLSKGKLYMKSKTPQEGYEKVTYGMNGEKVTYHKYVKNIEGFPKYFEVKEFEHEGKKLRFLELTLVDGDTSNQLSVPLKNTKGLYTNEVRLLISGLYHADLSRKLVLSTQIRKSTGKDNKEYKNLAIYINYKDSPLGDGRYESTGYIPYSEVPPAEKKIVAGDTINDYTNQTEFFYSKLKEIENKFNQQRSATPKQEEVNSDEQSDNINIDSNKADDLPF